MKKYLLLVAALGLFLFNSCSDDDDSAPTENSIEGTWRLAAVSPTNPFIDLSCTETPTITFNSNGTANWTMYDAQNDCQENAYSGTWEKNEGDSYTVGIPDFQEVEGTVDFTSNSSFTFSTTVQSLPIMLTFVK